MDLAAKLQLKSGQSVAVVGQPESVSLEFGGDHPLADGADQADGVLVFCRARQDLERLSDQFVAPAKRDALTWVAYPKAGKLGTDLNRDVLADLVKARGVQPVRQVALDDTWSALRLRPA
ncbi:MAG: DUF3052 family protein [Solirubrobacterales bacterium]|nr:DUF3052 family protein [Solirubrobacterales bacterium]